MAKSNGDQILENTGERMVPEFHQGSLTYAEHVTRYEAAAELVAGKTVLDIASGTGYGTQLMAKTAAKVFGVDVSEEAVEYSKKHFNAPNVEYITGSAEAIPLPDASVDVVVTFETLEHIEDYRKFMSEIKRVLKPDGIAVISTPNDPEFVEGNHFHLHEFEYQDLIDLVKTEFKHTNSYFQATWKYVGIMDEAVLGQAGSITLPTINMAPLSREQCLYFYLISSNRQITETITPRAALGSHYSDRYIDGTIIGLQQERAALSDEVIALRQTVLETQAELANIKASKRYKLASKLGDAKQMILPHHDKHE